MADASGNRDRYRRVVAAIPRGKVATYGLVARLAGVPRGAREVGRFLFHLEEGTDLPWHRVVNAAGAISFSPARGGGDLEQRELLEGEGVAFDAAGRIDLGRFLWDGKGALERGPRARTCSTRGAEARPSARVPRRRPRP